MSVFWNKSRISNINILFSYTFPPELNTLIICYFSFSYLFNPSTYTLVLFHAYYFIFSFNMLTFFLIILEHLKFSSDIIWYWYLFLEALFSVDLSESILLVKKFLDFCLSKTMDFNIYTVELWGTEDTFRGFIKLFS